MTAVNVFLRRDAVYVVTDGLAVMHSGVAVNSQPKVLPLPHLRAALATRGNVNLLPILYGIVVARHATFEAAAAGIGRDLEDAMRSLRSQDEIPAGQDLILTGWPETRQKAECWVATDSDRYGAEPYVPQPCEGMVTHPDSLEDMKHLLDRDAPFSPSMDGPAIIDAARRIPEAGVGAFCQVTTITRAGITITVPMRWDAAG